MNQDEARIIFAHDQSEMITHMPFLEDFASRCAVIIEIGSGHGNGSTRAFERGLRKAPKPSYEKLLITVDDNPDKPSLEPLFVRWYKITGDSREHSTAINAASTILMESHNAPVDLIYIDTDHTKRQLAAELANWSPLANKNTTWLFHDTWMSGMYNPMVEAIIEFCEAHPEWEYVELTKESHGLGMMRWKN